TIQELDYTGGSEPIQVDAGLVAGSLFETLGVKAAQGRTILREDDREGGERIVVLSHGFRQSRFNADEDVVGKTITLSGVVYTIVGVMPAGFALPESSPD